MTTEQLYKKIEEQYPHSKEWWVERLKRFPHNEWFAPNNTDEDFTYCNEMHIHGWCSKKIDPLWYNDIFKGNKIWFKFNLY